MGGSTRRRRAAPIALALAALAFPASAGAGLLEENPKKAELSTTGNDSELVKSLPIATTAGVNERTVMSIGPDQLKRIEVGDRMRVSGEVQVSTTCVARSTRCVGRRYEFNPSLAARIVLSPTPEPTRCLDPALGDQDGALQAAPAESQPPLHARVPQRRDADRRPRGAAVPEHRLLREPDRRRLEQEGPARQPRRPRGRPPRRRGCPGQGQAERDPGARQGAAADRPGEQRARQQLAAADRGQEAQAPRDPLGSDHGTASRARSWPSTAATWRRSTRFRSTSSSPRE